VSSGKIFSRGGAALPIAASGEGAYITDSSGRRYLDAAGGAIVVGIGHGRRAVGSHVQAHAQPEAPALISGGDDEHLRIQVAHGELDEQREQHGAITLLAVGT
jgi:adenosylmethionine-8-amino-7-oxononanoate aminotransferase